MNTIHRWLAAPVAAAMFRFVAVAADVPPAPASTAMAAEAVVTMDKFEVNEVPIEENIIPTSRPFNSVYGADLNILDTPRNVTIISREQMNIIGIQEVRDFSKLTSSSYTQTNFGLPSNPTIRGMYADVLVNGMRRGLTVNGNGMPVNFNAVESVNIVKGPAGVIFGASQYVGGYSDFITKRPYFNGFSGTASVTVGMYDQRRWTLDLGGPLSPEIAYRFSYSGEESDSYYILGKKNTHAVYGALEWRPTQDYTLEVNAELFVADVTENWGVNRVTQDLIDHGLYQTDALTDAEYETFLQTLSGFANPVQPYGPTIQFNRRRRLLAPGDDSYGVNVTAQAIQTLKFAGDARLVNNTFLNYINRDTFSSYYYNSVHKDNYALENRLSYQNAFEAGGTRHSYTAGFSFRYQYIWAVDDFYHEPVNSFDLSRDADTFRVPDSAFGGFNASVLIPGYGPRGALPGRYGTPGATYGFDPATGNVYMSGGSSNETWLRQWGPFYQHIVNVNDELTLIAGVRVDLLDVDYQDPLPPPGFTAVRDEETATLRSWNFAPTYKLSDRITAYYSYTFVQSTNVGLGGGYALGGSVEKPSVSDGVSLSKEDFDWDSYLHELGIKFSLRENTLFLGAAVFSQKTSNDLPGRGEAYAKSEGFEIEANFQPTRRFLATAAYSYYRGRQRGTGFLADSLVYDQRLSSAVPVSPDFPTTSGEFQQPGMPEHLVNFVMSYQFSEGFSASVSAVVTGPMTTSQQGPGVVFVPPTFDATPVTLTANEIPWQYTIDATLNYRWKKWEARLSIMNLTDEENWSAPNPGYGNGSINAELPARAELTFLTRF